MGHFEHALDLLACVDGGASFHDDAVYERLRPHLPRPLERRVRGASMNDARATLAQSLRRSGVAVTVVVVGGETAIVNDTDGGGPVTVVDVARIRDGSAIAL